MPAKLCKLPSPDPRYHFFTLADGSRIYPSGVVKIDQTDVPRWFAWRCTGSHEEDAWDETGKRRTVRLVREGEVLVGKEGVRYFDTPEEALDALNGVRKV